MPTTGCSVVLTKTQTFTKNSVYAVKWDSDSAAGKRCYNNGPCWTSEKPTRFTAPETGLYLIDAFVTLTKSLSGEKFFWIGGPGGEVAKRVLGETAYEGTEHNFAVSKQIRLEANEYVEVAVYAEVSENPVIEAAEYGSGDSVCRATFELIRV